MLTSGPPFRACCCTPEHCSTVYWRCPHCLGTLLPWEQPTCTSLLHCTCSVNLGPGDHQRYHSYESLCFSKAVWNSFFHFDMTDFEGNPGKLTSPCLKWKSNLTVENWNQNRKLLFLPFLQGAGRFENQPLCLTAVHCIEPTYLNNKIYNKEQSLGHRL